MLCNIISILKSCFCCRWSSEQS